MSLYFTTLVVAVAVQCRMSTYPESVSPQFVISHFLWRRDLKEQCSVPMLPIFTVSQRYFNAVV